MRRRRLGGGDDVAFAGAEAPEGDVGADRVVEQRDVLADDRDRVAQRGERHVPHVLAVDDDRALRSTSKSRGTRLMMVDLPAPERPTSATVLPPGTSSVKLEHGALFRVLVVAERDVVGRKSRLLRS